jgi:hypothetical protein
VRLALYVFGLRDRPVRNTSFTSDDADKLATAISRFPYDANARSRGGADFKEIACRLDHLESEDAGTLKRPETAPRFIWDMRMRSVRVPPRISSSTTPANSRDCGSPQAPRSAWPRTATGGGMKARTSTPERHPVRLPDQRPAALSALFTTGRCARGDCTLASSMDGAGLPPVPPASGGCGVLGSSPAWHPQPSR